MEDACGLGQGIQGSRWCGRKACAGFDIDIIN